MFSVTRGSSAILLLAAFLCIWHTVSADDNALTDGENKYLFDRLLLNLRSSENRHEALNDLIRNYIPIDHSTSARNKNVLLEVLANLGDVPFDFGGPADNTAAAASTNADDFWKNDVADDLEGTRVNIQLDDLSKRWGSGPGPRGKRFATAANSRVRRRDGPGPRGKRQGPRGKKQGPRGKKDDEDEDVFCLSNPCLQTMAQTRYVCDCGEKEDPTNCQGEIIEGTDAFSLWLRLMRGPSSMRGCRSTPAPTRPIVEDQ